MPTILRPTRITEFFSTLIDNIFTNCSNYNMDTCILIDDISDHLPAMLCLDLYFTTSRAFNTPIEHQSLMIRERILLRNHYNLQTGQSLNNWLALKVQTLLIPLLIINKNDSMMWPSPLLSVQ